MFDGPVSFNLQIKWWYLGIGSSGLLEKAFFKKLSMSYAEKLSFSIVKIRVFNAVLIE